MITQQRESSYSSLPIDAIRFPSAPLCYYTEVPAGSLDEQSRLVEQAICYALDMLDVYHLDVRVRGADRRLIDMHTQFDAQ